MSNRLATESSPYLRQHADNPVDWYPWSADALTIAREQNKPILLSIGYSACHWCHVMAHESFEDDATAAVMNRHFINIKVDREERPDIDRIYQMAHQLIAQRPGGWPLTMFLSPNDHLPFFGGTYFPNTPKYGMMAFADLLERIAELFVSEPDKIRQQGVAVHQALVDIEIRESQNRGGAQIDALETFEKQLSKAHDAEFGGFGHAPKFPQPAILTQALRRAFSKDEDDPVYRAIDFSLRQIALGGIQDHVGGGFYRYSVDDRWMIPHFEKMLYDNGQLLLVYAEAWRLNPISLYAEAVEGIVTWLEREMRTESGAFYAALDADSEGEEGKFYLWTPNEVQALIDPDAYPSFAYRFGLDQAANFEGHWHLHSYHEVAQVIDHLELSAKDYAKQHQQACAALLEVRNQRIPPGLDDKILTSWNALVIRGLATAARIFSRDDYHELAYGCIQALRDECRDGDNLLALSRVSGKHLPAYLDDYAHLLQACLDCLQYQWYSDLLDFAQVLAAALCERFEDKDFGGFFFTAKDHEKLIQRPKSWQDEAMPSGNAVAALALHRLGLLVGDQSLVGTAERALQSVADNVNQTPFYAAGFVALLEEVSYPPLQLILRGDAKTLRQWRSQVSPQLRPGESAYYIQIDAGNLPEIIAEKATEQPCAAWMCEGFSCRAPIFDADTLLNLLEERYQNPDRSG